VEVPSQDDALDRLKGDAGTPVVLTIQREGVPEHLTYKLVREIIHPQPELEKIMLTDTVGYVRLNSFNETSGKELLHNLRYLDGRGMKSCILDLRQNSGGLLTAAVEIADVFLPRGSPVVTTQGRRESDNKSYSTERNLPFTRIPLIILVDGQTASAAEIVTGAIRDNRRGKTIGMKTFGKGTVQEVIPLSDGSALKLTVARYYTPSGEMIDKKGINPDYLVPLDPKKMINPAGFQDTSKVELAVVALDLQLRKALELFGVPIPRSDF